MSETISPEILKKFEEQILNEEREIQHKKTEMHPRAEAVKSQGQVLEKLKLEVKLLEAGLVKAQASVAALQAEINELEQRRAQNHTKLESLRLELEKAMRERGKDQHHQ
jgi:chromosome segregation ATPase